MRVPSFLIYAVIIILGALVLSQGIALMNPDPMPLDIAINLQNLHIHIPLLYSLGTSVVLALLFWWWRR
jgi:5-hydroxyisourate hydrolase-like protein (transthyretin family)